MKARRAFIIGKDCLMDEELKFAGLTVASEVVETIVRLSAGKVDGVASVGLPSDFNGMFSFLTPRRPNPSTAPAVCVRADGDNLAIAIHLTVFFGYPFKTLAEEVRQAVVSNVSSQVGAQVSRVDVSIDAMVFPKE